jgi:hypothetical protein
MYPSAQCAGLSSVASSIGVRSAGAWRYQRTAWTRMKHGIGARCIMRLARNRWRGKELLHAI